MRTRGRGTKRAAVGLPFVVSLRPGATVYEGAEGQTTTLTFYIDRSGNVGFAGSVQWEAAAFGNNPATAADFGGAFPIETVQFGPDDMSLAVQVTIHGNNVIDGDRTFEILLSLPSTTGGSGIAVIGVGSIVATIIDDDAVTPTSNVEYGGNEAYYGGNPSEYAG